MNLRLQFPQGRLVKRERTVARDLAIASTSLIPPLCVMAYALAVWRLAADLGVARDSAPQGFFGHWQVWIALAVGLQLAGRSLSHRLSAKQDQATK
jgi:urea transporter